MIVTPQKFDKNFHFYTCDSKSNSNEMSILLTSDWHFDNPKTNRKMLFNHLDEALKRESYIIVNGDLLCLMQGKYDPRGSKSSILPEHNGDNYLDLVINDTAEKLKKYAHNILQINEGNHETSVSRRSETNVLERLVDRINLIAGSNIQLGAYTGFMNFMITTRGVSGRSFKIAYSHGNWGGVVTKGTLGVSRYAAFMSEADVVITGHTHDRWVMEFNQLKADMRKKKIVNKIQYHVKTGTYKEEFTSGSGWAVEKIGMPKSLGSVWLRAVYKREDDLQLEFTPTIDKY